MTNETIKRGIRKALMDNEIDCDKIQFSKIKKVNNNVVTIGKIIITLNSIDGICIDIVKSTIDNFLGDNNIDYLGILLDI
jgi:hypothetical protein